MPASIRYVDLASTKWGTISTVQTFAKEDAPSRAQRLLVPGDTIVGIVRPGNGSYALISNAGLTGSTGFAALRPNRDRRALVYLAATRRENIESLACLADGAAYPAVRPDAVIETPIALPANKLLDAFDRAASPYLHAKAGKEKQSGTLVSLRDTLLPKLISGELRIADAEQRIAAA